MQKLLTIYKFNFPFISEEFEETKYDSTINNLEELFLYNEICETKKITKTKEFKIVSFKLKNSKAEIIIYKGEKEKYFIPRIEFKFYSNKKINTNNILKEIFEIFISAGSNNYIFDYDEKDFTFNNSTNILTLLSLKHSLDNYDYNYFNKFLKNTPSGYLGEDLMANTILRNSLYYMIYLCFDFYNNLLKTGNGKEEIKNLLNKKTKIENKSILKLSETRLNSLEKDLLINFLNYKKILDKLFSLLK